MDNVCKFTPPPRTAHPLQTINFVYERHPQSIPPCPHATVYRVHLVTAGTGRVRVGSKEATVKAGDVFFSFPALPLEILADKELCYLYISYIGIRGAAETERCGIHAGRFVFEGFSWLEPIWTGALTLQNEPTELAAEGVLLYTLSAIGANTSPVKSADPPSPSGANFALIKKYIDEHFCDPTLCGDSISAYFCYNKKYISTLFKRRMTVGITEYIRTLRLNRAVELLEQGELGISEIAHTVGFHDALYFSKLFKAHTGCSPRAYVSKK